MKPFATDPNFKKLCMDFAEAKMSVKYARANEDRAIKALKAWYAQHPDERGKRCFTTPNGRVIQVWDTLGLRVGLKMFECDCTTVVVD